MCRFAYPFLLLPLWIHGSVFGQDASPAALARDARAILARACFACHGPDGSHREGGLRLDRADALGLGGVGGPVLIPGSPSRSLLVARITASDPGARMPPPSSGRTLTANDVSVLQAWIAGGAASVPHWAYVPPRRPPAPEPRDRAWGRGAIDRFVAREHERLHWNPSPEAEPATLLRRVTLDLTGLPPTLAEVEAFERDPSTDNYVRVVLDLTTRTTFAEHWARSWLDLARYADSAGYASDPLRVIWRYRDWVIDAWDRNLPYDRFLVEQLAGDLLPDATSDTRLATAFHRNTMTNTEGGTDDEEFRVAAVKDRANTTGAALLGSSFACAQCHDHKYDPLTQEDYYAFFAFFDQTEDTDQPDERPRAPTPTVEQTAQWTQLSKRMAHLEARLEDRSPEFVAARDRFLETVRDGFGAWRTANIADVRNEFGSTATIEDQVVTLQGDTARERTTVTSTDLPSAITALRLELVPGVDGVLGRSDRHPNVVLSDVRAWLVRGHSEHSAQRIRVRLPGGDRILSLAEVEVTSGDRNVARGRPTRQSSTGFGGAPERAVDGQRSGRYDDASVTHTATESDPWWEVDLECDVPVDAITLWNRTDGDLEGRCEGAIVELLDAMGRVTFASEPLSAARPVARIVPGATVTPLEFVRASASFEQGGFPVAAAIDDDPSSGTGWALSPRFREPQQAVFELKRTLAVEPHDRLQITLAQDYVANHVLGRFTWSASSDVPAPRAVPAAVRAALDRTAAQRTSDDLDHLDRWYREIAPSLTDIRSALSAARRERDALSVASTPVMRDLTPDRRRTTRVLSKGNFLLPGDVVTPHTPAHLEGPAPLSSPDRLGLARWITDPRNPLTARVIVNRIWSQIFGLGLVESEEDFGVQGTPPSHPELLDFLAFEFLESGQDLAALVRRIVTSRTYRQSSDVTPLTRERDPHNRWLARGPRHRLDAEMVRDQALAIAGLLTIEVGGPSVYPPQPDGLWQAAFNGADRNWPTSMGKDRFRRGLYTFLRRTAPYPGLATFDAPSRELCTVRRGRTNTPLQAFVTLNDPAFVECAQGFARRLVEEGGATPNERATFALRLALCRRPSLAEADRLVQLYDQSLRHYRIYTDAAVELSRADALPAWSHPTDAAELAAWTVVANVVLNLDAVLTKN